MHIVSRLVISLLLPPVLAVPAISQSTSEPGDPVSALDARLEALHRTSGFPGFSVAVIDRERTLYARGFGLADREQKVPFTEKTVLNIGSVSKTFIGVALLQALENEQIDLDAPIDVYLPYKVRNPRFPKASITLRHLATHTSGIEDRWTIYRKAYTKGEVPEKALGDYLRQYLTPEGKWYSPKNFGKHSPGAFYEYSNIAAALAAHVLERVNGKGFDELTASHILEPLGMSNSGWSYAAIDREKHARLYDGNKEVKPYTLVTYPDGGLRTSAASLARYLTAIANGGRLGEVRILEPESISTMLTRQFTADTSPKNYGPDDDNSGIFWGLRQNGLIGHTGGDPGISAFMFFDPETGFGRLFLTNTEVTRKQVDDFKAIWDALKDAYLF